MIAPGSVKICSLREVEHARYVIDAGADLFGLIFAPARRQVTVERARNIVQAVRAGASGDSPRAVGVFVDASADEINSVIQTVGLDLVQLHGSERPELIAELSVPAIKVFRPEPGTSVATVQRDLERFAAAARPPVAFLIEGFHPSQAGGAGVRADWLLVSKLAREWPIVLAGGLSPDSVAEAIEAVRSIAVDVGSGVETNGVKDPAMIAAFVQNARTAFAELVADR